MTWEQYRQYCNLIKFKLQKKNNPVVVKFVNSAIKNLLKDCK